MQVGQSDPGPYPLAEVSHWTPTERNISIKDFILRVYSHGLFYDLIQCEIYWDGKYSKQKD